MGWVHYRIEYIFSNKEEVVVDIFSITILEFEKLFRTEEPCIKYLRNSRWPNGFVYPKCEGILYSELSNGLFQCKGCRKQTSVTAGTIFHKTHIPLTIWFRVIYAIAQDKGGTSSTRVASQFGIQQKTAWFMLHRLRTAMLERNELTKLSGVIELDEAFINKEARKYQPEPGTETQILILVEEVDDHAGKIAVHICPAATSANIKMFVEDVTVPKKKHKFKTDGWHAHHVLRRMGHDADIQPLPGKLGSEKLPWLHTFVALIRRFLVGTHHGVSPKYLQLYLDELAFRANRRFNQRNIWKSLIRACSSAKPTKLAELTG